MPFVAFGDTARQLLDAYRYKWTVIKYFGNKTCRSTSVEMLDGELIAKEVGVTINIFDIKKQSEELNERPAPKYPVREPEANDQAAPAKTLKSWNAAPLVPDTTRFLSITSALPLPGWGFFMRCRSSARFSSNSVHLSSID